MPRYSWKGIRPDGSPCAGTQEASTIQSLSEQLLQEHIAMLEVTNTEKRKFVLFHKKITLPRSHRLSFVDNFNAHILIIPAVSIICKFT